MRDYDELVKRLKQSDDNCNAEHNECPAECDCPGYTIFLEAADAIEELQAQIADVGKMVSDLISYAQKNADESREAEQRHYGGDSTVNVYTWMHNVKRVHERYVAMLDDIAAKLPEPPKEDAE